MEGKDERDIYYYYYYYYYYPVILSHYHSTTTIFFLFHLPPKSYILRTPLSLSRKKSLWSGIGINKWVE